MNIRVENKFSNIHKTTEMGQTVLPNRKVRNTGKGQHNKTCAAATIYILHK